MNKLRNRTKKPLIFLALSFVLILILSLSISLTSCSGEIGEIQPDKIINQIFPSLWVFIAQMISMVIVFLLILFFVWKPANKMIDRRRQMILNEIAEGKEFKLEAEKELENARMLNANATAESEAIINDANIKANFIITETTENARLEASKILETARAQAERDVKKAKFEAEAEIIDTAIKAAEVLIKKEISKKDNEKLVKDFIKSLENDKQ